LISLGPRLVFLALSQIRERCVERLVEADALEESVLGL
jgi:hypothetical protein